MQVDPQIGTWRNQTKTLPPLLRRLSALRRRFLPGAGLHRDLISGALPLVTRSCQTGRQLDAATTTGWNHRSWVLKGLTRSALTPMQAPLVGAATSLGRCRQTLPPLPPLGCPAAVAVRLRHLLSCALRHRPQCRHRHCQAAAELARTAAAWCFAGPACLQAIEDNHQYVRKHMTTLIAQMPSCQNYSISVTGSPRRPHGHRAVCIQQLR